MIHVEFLRDRIAMSILRSNRIIGMIEASGLSNGEFGVLLRVGSHPNARSILEGNLSPGEAGLSIEQLQLITPKITSLKIDHNSPGSGRSDQVSIFGHLEDQGTLSPSLSFSKAESDAVASLLAQGKNLGPDTLAMLFERPRDEASTLLKKLQPRIVPPNSNFEGSEPEEGIGD